jgi:hypothetical protein
VVNFKSPEPAFRKTGIFLRVPVLSIPAPAVSKSRLTVTRVCQLLIDRPLHQGRASVGVTIPKEWNRTDRSLS